MPAALVHDARLKPLGTSGRLFRVSCGRHPRCGRLGELHGRLPGGIWTGPIDLAQRRVPRAVQDDGREWLLTSSLGFAPGPDGSYRVVQDRSLVVDGRYQPRQLVGRRPVPADLQTPEIEQQGGRAIVGHFPTLPAIIICPLCDLPSRVTPPSAP